MARTGKPYRLSRQAQADLEEIFAHTVKTWSMQQADRYIDSLEEAIEALAAGRRAGQARPELGPGYRVLGLASHFIVFRETEEIFVVRILHQSRDLARHLGANRS